MIFVTDASGHPTFVGPEWEELTGQSLAAAAGFGWIAFVHEEDRAVVRTIIGDAVRERSAFSLRYRIASRDGRWLWFAAGAIPSYGPPGRTFLGFLGSITRVADDLTDGLKADGCLGREDPPPPYPTTLPSAALEHVADHLIMAHALIVQEGGGLTRAAIEAALYAVGRELASRSRDESTPGRLH